MRTGCQSRGHRLVTTCAALAIVSISSSLVVFSANAAGMPLFDRKIVEQVKSESIPKAHAAMVAKKGSPVELGVDWKSFEGHASDLEKLENEAFIDVTRVFGLIAKDKAGKDALKQIKKVAIHRTAGSGEKAQLTVKGGALDYTLTPGRQTVMESDMKAIIESAL